MGLAQRREQGGGVLAFGSDWPVVTLNPWPGVQNALTRQTREGDPPGGFVPGERISLEDAIKAYTLGAAFAGHREKTEGSLEPGKLADLIVLSQDLFKIEPSQVSQHGSVVDHGGRKSGVPAPRDGRLRSGGEMTIRRFALWLSLLAAILLLGSCSKKTPSLNLLVWEGYADPSFVHGFEEQYHCKVSASYMGSSDELVAKLRGGSAGNYDVISPSSDVATSIAAAGLALPLDLSKIPSYSQLSPQLTSLPLVRMKGQVYGVPFMWGPDPLIYDTTVFPKPPESWTVLWDPKYRGKISVWDDLSTVYMAAQILGYDKPDPSQLYNLTDEQLERGQEKSCWS